MQFVHFSAPINDEKVNQLISAIGTLAGNNDRDIRILFDSSGGGVWPSQHALSMLRAFPVNLSIHNVGLVHSIANPIFLVADHRLCTPHATFVFHNITRAFPNGANLNSVQARAVMEGLEANTSAVVDWIASRTRLTHEVVAELFSGPNVIKTADWALENGYVDAIEDVQIPHGSPLLHVT